MVEVGGFHRTLSRQLRRLGLTSAASPDPVQWARMLDVVSSSYGEADADRYTLERSIEIASGEMRALHEVLSHRARHDSLTGLPNRAALSELLSETVSRQLGAVKVAVMFIDLDGFKLVNDSLGHSAGDDLLVRAAERIRSAVRNQDVVARQGGDEFVVLCVDIGDIGAATAIAERIARQLDAPFRIGAEDAIVSASIGVTMGTADLADPDDLLRQADMAMYRAKALGRSQFVVFDSEMQRQVDNRVSMQQALRLALNTRRGLLLHYQPVVDLAEHRLIGVEALVRWDRPGVGMVLPDEFIPVAEESRLISAIDSWVVHEACRQATAWPDDSVPIAVNLSARDLQHDDMVTAVSTALHDTGLAPRRLTVELTESTIMSDNVSIAVNLGRIQKLGVNVAIDDFGTGYSSLAYLRQLPASTLKMDRSFVATIDDDAVSAAIVGAIVTMGHALGLQIVAEGVERPAQARRLRELGCDAAQGYLYARPQPIEGLGRFFAGGALRAWDDELADTA